MFCFGFFLESSSPKPVKITLGSLRLFSKIHGDTVFASQGAPPLSMTPVANFPLVSTTPVANLPPVSMTPAANFATSTDGACCWYRWQITRTISDYWHLKVNLKEKKWSTVYVNSTIQRCPNKIIKTFQFEDFFFLTPVVHLEPRMSSRIFKKIEKAPLG